MRRSRLFAELSRASERPAPFSVYTADLLWTDDHISARMLEHHLNADTGLASRKHEFIERSAAWIANRFGLAPGISVADFGCGPGLYTTRFAGTGAAVTGIDFSARSIEHAQAEAERRGLRIEYVLADYLRFETDARYDLVTLIFCDLCALSPEQRAKLLGKFAGILGPGGALLLDVSSLAAFGRWRESSAFGRDFMNGFWSEADYFGFRFSFRYEAEKVTLDKYLIAEPARTWEVYNWLQYFSVDSLGRELEAAGLRVVEVLGDVAGAEYDERADQFAVVAVKT
jgi:SAM-dependent methyltransferase